MTDITPDAANTGIKPEATAPQTNPPTDIPTIYTTVHKIFEERSEKAIKDIRADLDRQVAFYRNSIGFLVILVTILGTVAAKLGYDAILDRVQETARARLDKAVAARVDQAITMQFTDQKLRDLVTSLAAKQTVPEIRDKVAAMLAADMFVRKNERYWVQSGQTGLNLDVYMAIEKIGQPVVTATPTPTQTWIFKDVK